MTDLAYLMPGDMIAVVGPTPGGSGLLAWRGQLRTRDDRLVEENTAGHLAAQMRFAETKPGVLNRLRIHAEELAVSGDYSVGDKAGDDVACPDCGVWPRRKHRPGCDVARCVVCGGQRISCAHADRLAGDGHIWTGRWPGEAECAELGWYARMGRGGWEPCRQDDPDAVPDLNRLALAGARGELRWTGQRWQA